MEIAKIIAEKPNNKNRSLFVMAGKEDMMIDYSHSQRIFDSFPGAKEIEFFKGSHNSQRPAEVFDKVFDFIEKQLGVKRKRK